MSETRACFDFFGAKKPGWGKGPPVPLHATALIVSHLLFS